jgi:hypothetical protein
VTVRRQPELGGHPLSGAAGPRTFGHAPSSTAPRAAWMRLAACTDAAAGGGLAGLALAGGARAPEVHDALLLAGAVCLLVGIPACVLPRAPRGPRSADAQAKVQSAVGQSG